MTNNRLKNISTSELLNELIERNALFRVDCGLYRYWELKGKSIIDRMIKWECEH